MEDDLDALTAAGLPLFDMNQEHLGRKNWSETSLGCRDDWSAALTCLVNSCILPMPHCAAIFWGADLVVIHNLAWGKARGDLDGQGSYAEDTYSDEALNSLRAALRGRTVKVAPKLFLKQIPDDRDDPQLLLSTLLDETGTRQGILAQLIGIKSLEKPAPIGGLAKITQSISSTWKNPKDLSDQIDNDSQQTQLFRQFAELLPNGLAILDKDAEAVFVNDGFFNLTSNKSGHEFRAWPESIHPDDYEHVMTAYRKAFSTREELRIEFRTSTEVNGEEGEWRLFLLRPLGQDMKSGFIAAIVDITEIKEAQLSQERAATEAQERKQQQERFIDMVSHEIRNPLSAVLHLAEEVKEITNEIITSHEDLREQVADILDAADTILLCVSHQNTLVDDILSFSKLDSMMLSLVPRETRPKWEFSSALKVFQSEFRAKSIKFHYAMDSSFDEQGIDYVIADLNRMKQVLVNLITNAIKFTSKKKGEKKITVSMGASTERPTSYPPSVIFFSTEKDSFHIDSTMTAEWGGGEHIYLMVAVKDTGIGISQEGQTRLFERFRQATPKTQENYGGSGLGLFISRKLCQLHGGDIGVSAKEGEGSTFGFFFKVRRSLEPKDEGRPQASSRSNSESSQVTQSQTPRPSFSRANSNLPDIKERSNERVSAKTLREHQGVDAEQVNQSLLNPPTEHRKEAHPQANKADSRFKETEKIASAVEMKTDGVTEKLEGKLPNLTRGETQRQQSSAESISRAQSLQPSVEKQTLLLVEDNLINQKVLRRQLQSRGFEVFTANNGQEAVDAVVERGEVAKENSNDRNYFDCILMDQEMPLKSGNVATGEIRQLQEQGKAGYSHILGVSANVREAQTKSMLEAGMNAVISKPFKVEDLVKKINNLINDKPTPVSKKPEENSGSVTAPDKPQGPDLELPTRPKPSPQQ